MGRADDFRGRDDRWRRIVWTQTWFGETVDVRYTFDPEGRLVRIDYSTPDASRTADAISAELGAATDARPAPQYMNATSVATWERDGFALTLEDYAPGCEIGIIARRRKEAR